MTVLGNMQPYIFPYIGYFQLIREVDVFVVSSTLNYIKKGWINRNRLKCGSIVYRFTVPVKKWHMGQAIIDVMVHEENYDKWRKKFFETLYHFYCKAPYYKPVKDILNDVFRKTDNLSINDLATRSIKKTVDYLGIDTRIILSPEKYGNLHLEK